jgi:hypothetical protein
VKVLVLVTALLLASPSIAKDLIAPGDVGGNVPVAPIVATAAAGGVLAWILARLRRKKGVASARPEPPREEVRPGEPAEA